MTKPPRHAGMRHVALFSTRLEDSVDFYTQVLGMTVEWQPDPDNYYLTSGTDNLALHRVDKLPNDTDQRLDHIGFLVDSAEDVDRWEEHLKHHGVEIVQSPKTHRDGARSLYCKDPDDTVVQIIYHPPLVGTR